MQAQGQRSKILIVGSGFGGLGMAICLKQQGIHDFKIIERAAEVGGTWRDNTYPGVACDVPSHLYSFSFIKNPDWSRVFPHGAEIQRYLTPDLYQSMYQDIMANQDQDVAEFSNLNAMVVDSATENGQYVISVRFTGTVSEDLNSLPQPFTEIWHFVKPAGSNQDWLVAGIQQEQ